MAPAECSCESFDTAASVVGSDLFTGEHDEQRRKRYAVNDSGVSSGSRGSQPAVKRQRTGGDGLILQCMEEYNIEQMEVRAERLSDMPAIRDAIHMMSSFHYRVVS